MRLLILGLAAISVACGSEGGKQKVASRGTGSCRAPDDSLVARAVTEFVKQASPTPQRFLATSSGDSAIPDLARIALQDKGPTYLYPADSALRAKVVQKLVSVGDYTAMAVVYRGTDQPDAKRVAVKLGGNYVDVGKGAAPSISGTMEFTCDDSTKVWKFTGKAPTPTS